MKNLIVIALGKNTSRAFNEQLHKLLGNRVNIHSYYLGMQIPADIQADVVLFSSKEALAKIKLPMQWHCPTLIAKRSINYHEVGKLFDIPAGTDVLLVNDLLSSANQTIALLQTLGINHINYHLYAPEILDYPHLKIAVTPGEAELVPSFVKEIIDIKTRQIDITTLVEVLMHLNLLDVFADFLSANYVRDIIRLTKNIYEMMQGNHRRQKKIAQRQNAAHYTFSQVIGQSEAIRDVLTLAEKMAQSNATILIQGESGTGKEMIAQGIHNASKRRHGPFVAVNFAALTESILESELFGYTEGAFTGANRGGAPGLFEEAHKGTIFLDEIGDAPLPFQIKLLRVLQEHQVRRIGSAKTIPIDVRVIVATNRNLKKLIDEGSFRQDLYYRLNVLPIKIPPLRERTTDILLLAETFYEAEQSIYRKIKAKEYFALIAPYLKKYAWPGNIREVQNTVEYLINICPNMPPQPNHLPADIYEETKICLSPADKAEQWKKIILHEIDNANKAGRSIGRRSLAEKLDLPENQIRAIIQELAEEKRILLQKGRNGLQLL